MRLLLRIAIISIAIYYAYSDILPTIRKVQSVAVKGKLLCSGKPYEKARLKLYEVDPGRSFFSRKNCCDFSSYRHFDVRTTVRCKRWIQLEGQWHRMDHHRRQVCNFYKLLEKSVYLFRLNIYHNCEDEAIVRKNMQLFEANLKIFRSAGERSKSTSPMTSSPKEPSQIRLSIREFWTWTRSILARAVTASTNFKFL